MSVFFIDYVNLNMSYGRNRKQKIYLINARASWLSHDARAFIK